MLWEFCRSYNLLSCIQLENALKFMSFLKCRRQHILFKMHTLVPLIKNLTDSNANADYLLQSLPIWGEEAVVTLVSISWSVVIKRLWDINLLSRFALYLPANYTTPKEKTSESKVLEQSSINNAARFTLNMLKKGNF